MTNSGSDSKTHAAPQSDHQRLLASIDRIVAETEQQHSVEDSKGARLTNRRATRELWHQPGGRLMLLLLFAGVLLSVVMPSQSKLSEGLVIVAIVGLLVCLLPSALALHAYRADRNSRRFEQRLRRRR